MVVEMVINSWFGYGAGNNMIKNHGKNQFKFKQLSQSIWFNLINVLLLLTVIVGLGFFFLLIWICKSIKFVIFCYKIVIYLFFNTAPPFFLGLHARGCCSTPTSDAWCCRERTNFVKFCSEGVTAQWSCDCKLQSVRRAQTRDLTRGIAESVRSQM